MSPIHSAYKLKIDKVLVILVAHGTVSFYQLNAVSLDAVNRADLSPILANDLHVFSNFRHDLLPTVLF